MLDLEARCQAIASQPGDVLLVTVPEPLPPDNAAALMRWVRDHLPGRYLLIMQEGYTLEAVSPDQMRRAGWVRADG